MSKVIDSMWFNTFRGSFGIILTEDETTGERKLYAGASAGFDQQADEQAILSWGNKVNLGLLESLLARAKKSRESERSPGIGCGGCGAIAEGTPENLPPGWKIRRHRGGHDYRCPNCQKKPKKASV